MGTATFTKWMIGEGPGMAGVVGGAVGEGAYAGKVLDYVPGPTTVVEATYQFNGSTRPFTALVHVEQTNRPEGGNHRGGNRRLGQGQSRDRGIHGDQVRPRRDHDGLLERHARNCG